MAGSKATPLNVPVVLPLITVELTEASAWHCLACRSDLDLSQPSAQNPDMLLGTCPRCDAWYLFYQSEAAPNCLVLRLPNATEVETAAAPTTTVTATATAAAPRRSRGSRQG